MIKFNVLAQFTVNISDYKNREEMFTELGRVIDELEMNYGGLLEDINMEKVFIPDENRNRITSISVVVRCVGVRTGEMANDNRIKFHITDNGNAANLMKVTRNGEVIGTVETLDDAIKQILTVGAHNNDCRNGAVITMELSLPTCDGDH